MHCFNNNDFWLFTYLQAFLLKVILLIEIHELARGQVGCLDRGSCNTSPHIFHRFTGSKLKATLYNIHQHDKKTLLDTFHLDHRENFKSRAVGFQRFRVESIFEPLGLDFGLTSEP